VNIASDFELRPFHWLEGAARKALSYMGSIDNSRDGG
jgi:hypothetical protein